MKLEEWKTLSQEEKQKFWENEKNKLEAEKLKLAEAMELVDELYSEGFTPKGLSETNNSIDGDAFDEAVSKLLGNSWRLTKEDEETILLIANKLCYVS
jgi:hypothetical protein